ncbi:MAG: hypothetical protein AABX80_01865 [Nanoarchaeota archaeon]
MKILIFILIFFIIVGLILINNNNLHLSDKKELKTFSQLYFNWLGQIYSNFFSINGHVSKLNWLPN